MNKHSIHNNIDTIYKNRQYKQTDEQTKPHSHNVSCSCPSPIYKCAVENLISCTCSKMARKETKFFLEKTQNICR